MWRALSLPFNKLIRPHEYGSESCAPGHFVSHCSRCESFYLWHGKAKKPQRQIVVRTRRHSIINIKYNVPYYPCHMCMNKRVCERERESTKAATALTPSKKGRKKQHVMSSNDMIWSSFRRIMAKIRFSIYYCFTVVNGMYFVACLDKATNGTET